MIKITACTILPGRLFTTASSDKKLFKTLSLTTFGAGLGLDGHFNFIQSVAVVGPFIDDTVSVY